MAETAEMAVSNFSHRARSKVALLNEKSRAFAQLSPSGAIR